MNCQKIGVAVAVDVGDADGNCPIRNVSSRLILAGGAIRRGDDQ
jgi:hypothetical protein